MRGKKAKALRRMAEKVTHGQSPSVTRQVYRRWKNIMPVGQTPFTDVKQ